MNEKIARYQEIERRGLLDRLPPEKQAVWAEIKRRGLDVKQPEQIQPAQDNFSGLDKAKYTLRAAGEGATLGLADLNAGFTNAMASDLAKVTHGSAQDKLEGTRNLTRTVFGGPFGYLSQVFRPEYKQGRKDFVREQNAFGETHPVLNFAGELGGGLVTGIAGAGKKLAQTAAKQGLKALSKESAREGAKFGLVYGAGSGLTQDAEKLSVSNALKGGAEGLITGAVLGAAVPVAVTGTGRGVQRFLGTKGYAQRAADEIFKEAGGKEIGQVVRTEKGTRALKEAIKADDKVARAVRDVSDQKLIDSADKTKDIINDTLGIDNIVNAKAQASALYDDVVNNSKSVLPTSLYRNKAMRKALKKALEEDYLGQLEKKGINSLAVAQKAKEKLDDMIGASYQMGDYGVLKKTSNTYALEGVKNNFLNTVDKLAPEYKVARKQFELATKPYDLLEGLTKTTGRERANTIKSVLTNKNKEAISSVFGKEKAGQLFDTLRAQSIENERFNKLYNAAENKLTKETPKTQEGLAREAFESKGSVWGHALDMLRFGGATRGRRRIGEILLGMGEKEATRPNLSVSGILANKLKEKGGFAWKDLSKKEQKRILDIISNEQGQIAKGYEEVMNNPLKGTRTGKDDILATLQPDDLTYFINRGAAIKDPKTGDIVISGDELKKATGTYDNFGFSKMIFKHGITPEEAQKLPSIIRDYEPIMEGKDLVYRIPKDNGHNYRIVFTEGKNGGNILITMMPERISKKNPKTLSTKKEVAIPTSAFADGLRDTSRQDTIREGFAPNVRNSISAITTPESATSANSIGKKGGKVNSISKILNKEKQ